VGGFSINDDKNFLLRTIEMHIVIGTGKPLALALALALTLTTSFGTL
jgi:hypothetical protein